MALPLEQKIMNEVGLGQHYGWYNDSGSCQYIRHDAADKLADVIQKYHDQDGEIAAPNHSLVAIVKQIAHYGDNGRYTLTKTWQAASYVIAHHIHVFGLDDKDASKRGQELKKYQGFSISFIAINGSISEEPVAGKLHGGFCEGHSSSHIILT